MASDNILIWVGVSMFFALVFLIEMVMLIIINKKTHAIIEFKSSLKGNPIAVFFQDNRYCEWKNTKPEAGMIDDKDYGAFVIDSTYIDKKTKNVLVPFNSNFAMSLSAKAAKMSDDLNYMFKEQSNRAILKSGIVSGKVAETSGINTLRTSINFSAVKSFVSPILPHNIQSKISNTIAWRLKNYNARSVQNIVLIIIAAIGALVLGGLVLKYVAF